MRKAIHIALALLLVAQAQAQMIIVIKKPAAGGTITFGTPITCSTYADTSPATCSITVPGGTNVGMVVVAGLYSNSGISAMTYNGVAANSITNQTDGCACAVSRSALAIFINPTTGSSQTLSATFTGSFISFTAVPVYGINQTGTVGNSWRTVQTASGNSTTASVNVSNAVSGDAVVDVVSAYVQALTPDGSQTTLVASNQPGGGGTHWGASRKTASGATTMQWTLTSSYWSAIGVALIPQ